MEADIFNMEGKKVRSVELSTVIFEAPINVDLMHQAYVRQLANARLGTHSTKGRSDVAGGGRKPWRQKGTGRARQGSIRSAQWVGGGKIHTPKPRNYSKKMTKKMRRAALRSALSVKAAEESIILVDELSFGEPRTQIMAQALERIIGDATVLILLPEKTEANDLITRSTNNLPYVKTLNANYLNIRDLLGYDRVIVPLQALDIIESYLG
ncbi:MAG: 50S ribosomal protein L4 [Chloroflexota bacterium]|nr:50S ribosomal protein L4 [Chloroflexota bacterium]